MKFIEIDGRRVSLDVYPYLVAELSANHNGSIELAFSAIEQAKRRGADAIKIQSYTADTITLDCNRKEFIIDDGLWAGESLYSLYKRAETPFEWHKELFSHAKKNGITIFSSPFDETAVELLEALGNPAYKIASFELLDHGLLECVAKTKKPIIASIGMASETEISEALEVVRSAGNEEIVLLHCISSYPAPVSEYNLATISDIPKKFGVLSGLSDHSIGNIVPVVAVSHGAVLIEKHFSPDKSVDSPDSSFSMDERELGELRRDVNSAYSSIGEVLYSVTPSEETSLQFRRSLYASKSLSRGDIVTKENIRSIRPGYGLHPKYMKIILGMRAKIDIEKCTPLSLDMFE